MQDVQNEKRSLELLKKAAFFCVLFFCVFIPLRSVLELYTHSLVKVIPDLMIVALLGWYAVVIRFRFRFRVHDWLFLGFLFLAFIGSVLVNHTGLMPYIFQVRSIGIYYILYFVLRNLDFGKKQFTAITTTLQVMAVILLLFSLVEKVCSKTVLFPASIAEGILYASNFTRAYSLFFNPNTYAVFIVFVFFMSLLRRVVFSVKTSPVMYGCLLMSLLFSMSRSGIIILSVGLAVAALYLVIKYRRGLPYLSIALCAVIALAIGAGGYFAAKWGASEYHSLVLQNSDKDNDTISGSIDIGVTDRLDDTVSNEEIHNSTQNGRLYSVSKGLEVFRDHPIIGTGFGSFGSAANMNFKPATAEQYDLPFPFYSDMQYITILAETGTLGTLLFVLFLAFILLYFRRQPAKLLFCVVFGAFGCFYNIFETQIASMLFWTILSIDHLSLPKDASVWRTPDGSVRLPKNRKSIDMEEIKQLELRILEAFISYCENHKLRAAKIDALSQQYPYETSEYVSVANSQTCLKAMMPRKAFEDMIQVPFENLTVAIPSVYDTYLKGLYGDYMTPPPTHLRTPIHQYECWWKEDKHGEHC